MEIHLKSKVALTWVGSLDGLLLGACVGDALGDLVGSLVMLGSIVVVVPGVVSTVCSFWKAGVVKVSRHRNSNTQSKFALTYSQ